MSDADAGQIPTTVEWCGTYAMYQRGCRCRPCTDAARDYTRSWRGRVVLAREDPRHGTVNGYTNYGCRCARCRAAYRDNRIPAAVLRQQLRRFFRPGDRHPYVGLGPCLLCGKPPHDNEGKPQ